MTSDAMELLDDIRRLFESGNPHDALDLVDAYLSEYPEEVEAELLKAEICLTTERDAGYVGNLLRKLSPPRVDEERLTDLRTRAETLTRTKLAEGRAHLQGRDASADEALACFDLAVHLSPADASAPLAAGLALLHQEEEEDTGFRLPFERPSPRPRPPANRAELAEKYLLLSLERGTPSEQAYQQAARHLITYWLSKQQVDRALDLLGSFSQHNDMITRMTDDTAKHAVELALDVCITLMRAGQYDDAQLLLTACADAAPWSVTLHALRAEVLALVGRPADAMADYERALELLIQESQPFEFEAAQAAWNMAKTIQITCPHCGKLTPAQLQKCTFCAMSLGESDLLIDRYELGQAYRTAAIHIGTAELLAAQNRFADALSHLKAALDDLPTRHGARPKLNDLHSEWSARQKALPVSRPELARHVLDHFRRDGLTTDVIVQARDVSRKDPADWFNQPVQSRLALVRTLIRADHLELARELHRVMFADNPARPSVRKVAAQLDQVITARLAALTASAEQASETGQLEQAIELAETALALCRDNALARLVRGEARQRLNQDLKALGDFHTVLHSHPTAEIAYRARLGAARALENRWNFDAALELLDDLHDPEATSIRTRLQRRQRSEPAVHLVRTGQAVMHDTLARADTEPQYQGFFAVTVRSVGRPWGTSQNEWYESILNRGIEFVKVLGGLRNVTGYPIFALRLISTPNAQIAERGRLSLALLVRVSADSEPACCAQALELWRMLVGILPSSQQYVYNFEPVVDETELAWLLEPFEMAEMAEIVRREDVPQRDGDRYAVYPFTPGTLDLHDLCWALLRQEGPAMVSIHLLPTDLMAWERATMDEMMLGEREPASKYAGGISSQNSNDPVSEWWEGAPRWGQAQANRYVVDYLRSQAYVLRVNVAGSAGASPLLPETTAAALFGPVRPVSNALFGGYDIIRASTDEERAIAHRNLATIDVEAWSYSAAPDGAARLRHLVGESEASLAFRLPVPDYRGLPGLPVIDAKPVAPPANLPVRGTMLGASVTQVGGAPLRIVQGEDDRRRHTYIVGKTGVGKSTLIGAMALQDIEAGAGVCVVDPHGDLVEEILARIPERRERDVILFDPSDEERPIGLNLLEARSEPEKHRIVTEFIGLLVRMYDPTQMGIVGPRFQHNVRNAMLTVMALEDSTLIEVVRALTDIDYVRNVLPHVTDPLVRNYWEKQIAQTSDFHKSEILDYIVSKFSRFVGDRLVRNIVGQRHTTVDFREVMDKKRILLVNLSKGKIGPESAQFLGLLLVQRLLLTALSRADVPPEQRPDFFLYVDEFQNFATEMFATVLSEGRKYGVAVTIANQYLTQLDYDIREAIFGNVGSIVSFRLGTQDAAALAPEVYPVFGPDDLINLPKFTACVKLLVDGVAARPFTMRTMPDTRPANPARTQAIRQASRQIYGRDAAAISEDVMARFVPPR